MIEPTTDLGASGFALRLVGTITGRGTSLDGAYVASYDPDAHEGAGRLRVTRQVTKARHFGDPVSAQQYYERQSIARPLGRDGRPNRPLTRYNVKVVWVGLPEDAGMSDYTCYFVGARHAVMASESIEAESDAAAERKSRALFLERGVAGRGFEVWQRDRRIHSSLAEPESLVESSAAGRASDRQPVRERK